MKNKKIYLSPPQLSGDELKNIEKVLDSGWISPNGPEIKSFEKEFSDYLKIKSSLALSSGTAALHLALRVLNVKKNDYVFCSDLTFVASANVIKYVGATPIFIDSNNYDLNICPESLELAFKKFSPKAVIVTNIYGQSANYIPIIEICKKYETPIVEDAAESLGAKYNSRNSGTFGTISAFSFNGNKIITTSGGGMLSSNNEDYIKKAKKLSTQAKEDEIHYEHKDLGYNYRLSNVLAAIGRAQLKTLNERILIKRKIFDKYYSEFNGKFGIKFMNEPKNYVSTKWLTVIFFEKFEPLELILFLMKQSIESRPVWKPMHLQPYYRDMKIVSKSKKNIISESIYKYGLCLPSGLSMNDKEQNKVIEAVKSFFKKKTNNKNH